MHGSAGEWDIMTLSALVLVFREKEGDQKIGKLFIDCILAPG